MGRRGRCPPPGAELRAPAWALGGSGVGGSGVGGSGVGSTVGSTVGSGIRVAPAVGLGVGFRVGLGVALTTPQVLDDEAVLVGPEPADGIVARPSGRTPGSVNRRAARARILSRFGSWMLPRLSYVPRT